MAAERRTLSPLVQALSYAIFLAGAFACGAAKITIPAGAREALAAVGGFGAKAMLHDLSGPILGPTSIAVLLLVLRWRIMPTIRFIQRALGIEQSNPDGGTMAWLIKSIYGPIEKLVWLTAGVKILEPVLAMSTWLAPALSLEVQKRANIVLALGTIVASLQVARSAGNRFFDQKLFDLEIQGKTSERGALSGLERIYILAINVVAAVAGMNAVGLNIKGVLALGGIGSLAIGLAGRDILENLFSGLLIFTSNPFRVGDEVCFTAGREVRGVVLSIGFYKTLVRSADREIVSVPNAHFIRSVVINVTRRGREHRFNHEIPLEIPPDLDILDDITDDVRALLASHPRVVAKLFRRVFISKVARGEVVLAIACVVDAANKDQYLSVESELILSALRVIRRRGGEVAPLVLEAPVSPVLADIVQLQLQLQQQALEQSEGGPLDAEGRERDAAGSAAGVVAGVAAAAAAGGGGLKGFLQMQSMDKEGGEEEEEEEAAEAGANKFSS